MFSFSRTKRETRHATHQKVWALPERGFAKRECTIVNISANGAKLRVDDPDFLGSTFGIAFTHDVRKLTVCRVVWRSSTALGVEFCE
jgi:hypothetical protein